MYSIGHSLSTTLGSPIGVGGPFPPKEGQTLKALLIGVCGSANASSDFPELHAAHPDVEKMRILLIKRYYYRPCDITVLIDDGVPDHVQPTHTNILKAIHDLVKDAKPGDRFSFHYSGHATQIESCSNDGGLDECIVPCDSNGSDNVITDTALNAALVMPLPSGSQLVAILDACHSGSLLDLKHRKGNRDVSITFGSGVQRVLTRKNARLLSILTNQGKLPPSKPATLLLARRSELSMTLIDSGYKPMDGPTRSGSGPRPTFTYRAPTVTPAAKTKLTLLTMGESDEVASTLPGEFRVFPELQLCEDPETMFSERGFYKDPNAAVADPEEFLGGVKADVISLSSCREDQIAYEDGQGNTMTSVLVDGLMRKPDQSLKEVLLFLSQAMETQAHQRHAQAEAYKKVCLRLQRLIEKENKKLHARAMTLVNLESFVTPSALQRLSTLPARADKSLEIRRDMLHRLGLKQRLLDMTVGRASPTRFDTHRVQDPEFSSASPLDMMRPWPMWRRSQAGGGSFY